MCKSRGTIPYNFAIARNYDQPMRTMAIYEGKISQYARSGRFPGFDGVPIGVNTYLISGKNTEKTSLMGKLFIDGT